MPEVSREDTDLEIFDEPVAALRRSQAYPYGLTDALIARLHEGNIYTVGQLYSATEEELDALHYVGEIRVKQMKNLVSQAIWL
jgi:hypothetical protein